MAVEDTNARWSRTAAGLPCRSRIGYLNGGKARAGRRRHPPARATTQRNLGPEQPNSTRNHIRLTDLVSTPTRR